ncbi:MAG: molybdopterin molybdotransferase MoeA [Fidelibacterota bacterium]|nr:MAG: molybdopterin molybdotransferase MoeA [Candidatus Neomarinimicrobiota bacterium]
MLTIEAAREIVREHTPTPRIQERRLTGARGLYLAERVTAPEQLPRVDNSAMDGYAVALPGNASINKPIKLKIIGESRAGMPWVGALTAGTAVQISTGAPVPDGADRVIPVEDTTRENDCVWLKTAGQVHDHIRFAGREVLAGDVIAEKQVKLTPPVVAWLAGFGIDRVKVFTPPRVSLITTGEELADINQTLKPGQDLNTNRIFLENLLAGEGLEPAYCRHVPDALEATIEALDEAGRDSELLITVGGVSVGEHDHVKAAAEQVGFKQHFWKVAQKPGKPLYFASRNRTLLFGLPGNPASVVITSMVYVYPTLKRLLGATNPELRTLAGRFGQPVEVLDSGREKLLLVSIIGYQQHTARLQPGGPQQSHMLSTVTNSDGFIIVPGEKTTIAENETFSVNLFPWAEIRGTSAQSKRTDNG